MPIDYGPRPSIRLADTRGEASAFAKLTDEIVMTMRRERPRQPHRWLAGRGIAVHRSTAMKALRGTSWRHLPLDGVA